MRSRQLGGRDVPPSAEILWKGGRGLGGLRIASRRSGARCISIGQCSSVGRGLQSRHRILGRRDGRRIRRHPRICARGPGSGRRTGSGPNGSERMGNPCTGSGRMGNRCSGSRCDIAGGHRRRHGRACRIGRRCCGRRRKSSRRTGSGCMRGRRISRRRNGAAMGTRHPGSACGIVGRCGVRSLRIQGLRREGRGHRVGCNRRSGRVSCPSHSRSRSPSSGRIGGHGHGRIRKLAHSRIGEFGRSRIGELGRSRIRGPARYRRRALGRSCAKGPGRRRLGGPSPGCISGPDLGHSRVLGRSRMRGPS